MNKIIILAVFCSGLIYAIGEECGCRYDYAGSQCSRGPTIGARNLATYLTTTYGGKTEIFNCRNIAGSNEKSLHAEGRAVDLFPGSTAIFNALIRIACTKGIQEVIYNRKIWTFRGGIKRYNGLNPHTSHLHVGLNRCGARNFQS